MEITILIGRQALKVEKKIKLSHLGTLRRDTSKVCNFETICATLNQMRVIETAHSMIDFYKNFCYNIYIRYGNGD